MMLANSLIIIILLMEESFNTTIDGFEACFTLTGGSITLSLKSFEEGTVLFAHYSKDSMPTVLTNVINTPAEMFMVLKELKSGDVKLSEKHELVLAMQMFVIKREFFLPLEKAELSAEDKLKHENSKLLKKVEEAEALRELQETAHKKCRLQYTQYIEKVKKQKEETDCKFEELMKQLQKSKIQTISKKQAKKSKKLQQRVIQLQQSESKLLDKIKYLNGSLEEHKINIEAKQNQNKKLLVQLNELQSKPKKFKEKEGIVKKKINEGQEQKVTVVICSILQQLIVKDITEKTSQLYNIERRLLPYCYLHKKYYDSQLNLNGGVLIGKFSHRMYDFDNLHFYLGELIFHKIDTTGLLAYIYKKLKGQFLIFNHEYDGVRPYELQNMLYLMFKNAQIQLQTQQYYDLQYYDDPKDIPYSIVQKGNIYQLTIWYDMDTKNLYHRFIYSETHKQYAQSMVKGLKRIK